MQQRGLTRRLIFCSGISSPTAFGALFSRRGHSAAFGALCFSRGDRVAAAEVSGRSAVPNAEEFNHGSAYWRRCDQHTPQRHRLLGQVEALLKDEVSKLLSRPKMSQGREEALEDRPPGPRLDSAVVVV